MKSLIIYEAQSFNYPFGTATIQRGQGEMDTVIRLWNGLPQAWWNIPIHPAYDGMVERIYAHWVQDEFELAAGSINEGNPET